MAPESLAGEKHCFTLQQVRIQPELEGGGRKGGTFYRFIRLLAFWLACSMRDTLRTACRERESRRDG